MKKEIYMSSIYKKAVYVSSLCLLPVVSQAAVITFDFTGRLVVADPAGVILGPAYTPISASLAFDTDTGIGNSGLSIVMNDFYLGAPATIHDISMSRIENTNLINGEVLVDWNGTNNMSMHVQWDATGLFNAIDMGLQEWDVLSGSVLYHDANHNGVQDAGELGQDIGSVMPYSDSLQMLGLGNEQGAAPMAATSGSLGMAASTPFPGIRGYLDIGSGNSMHVTSVSAVPVPAAVWLFGSGLIGLFAVAKKRKVA